jgi:hypothetical protein
LRRAREERHRERKEEEGWSSRISSSLLFNMEREKGMVVEE